MTTADATFLAVCLVICVVSVLTNVALLAVFIKLYTEVLKIGHIKNIGRAEPRD